MNEMIERVALVIWALNEDTDCYDYERLSAHAKKRADDWARAAIEAMREPTQAMIDNAHDRIHGGENEADVWRGMIDEALKG